MQPNYSDRTCYLIESAIDASAAASIVEAAERAGFRSSARDYPPSYRDNSRLVHDDATLAQAIFDRLGDRLPGELVDRHGDVWELQGLNDRFRLCRYENGQSFRIHRDGAHAPSAAVRSHLTLQIYLDEDFDGGRTRFFSGRSGKQIGAFTPRTGRAIVFDHQLWHDGEPVVRGVKHVLRADVMYRRRTKKDVRAEPNVLVAHGGYVFALEVLADGSLVSASRDRTVRRFIERGGEWIATHVDRSHDASIHTLVEAKPNVVWSGSRDRTIRALDLSPGCPRTGSSSVVAALGGAVLSLAKINGTLIAAGCSDASVYLLDVDARRHLRVAGHQGWVWSVVGLRCEKAELDLVASGSEDGTIRVIRTDGTFVASASPKRGPVHALLASADGRLLAGFADGHVVTYELDRHRGVLVAIDVIQASRGEIYALALKDGLLAVGGEDEQARVLRTGGGGGGAHFAHDDFVRSVKWLPDGRLVTASYDGAIRFFEPDPT